jgi:hypothetical protein
MSKNLKKPARKNLALNRKTINTLSSSVVSAELQNTQRPIIIVSGGCGTDFTKLLATDFTRILMTDITRPR